MRNYEMSCNKWDFLELPSESEQIPQLCTFNHHKTLQNDFNNRAWYFSVCFIFWACSAPGFFPPKDRKYTTCITSMRVLCKVDCEVRYFAFYFFYTEL